MKTCVVHQTRIHQARIHRFHPFYKKTNKQFRRDQVQSTEAIGYRLIQLMIAKFHDASCNKDYAASENDLRETKQLFMKLRQLHPEHWYRKQSVPVDHGQCRTSDDICFTLYCLRFWRR